MSLHQEIALEPFASLGGAPARGQGAFRRALRSRVWLARLATLWGIAGAVLVQTAVFGLIARLVLEIDLAVLPGSAASLAGLALGALAMATSKSLTAPSELAG